MLKRNGFIAAVGLFCSYTHALPIDHNVKCAETIFKGETVKKGNVNICLLGNGNIRYTQTQPNKKSLALGFDEPVSNTRLIVSDEYGVSSRVIIIGNKDLIVLAGVQEKNKSGVKDVLVSLFNSNETLHTEKIDPKTFTHNIGRHLSSKGIKEAKD